MVILTSSTGDGEPPSNASKFWRKIRREKNPKFLSHMKYTVLGTNNNISILNTFFDVKNFIQDWVIQIIRTFVIVLVCLIVVLKNLVLHDFILQHGRMMLLGIVEFFQ